MFARNHFGWSESSKIVRFATGGEGGYYEKKYKKMLQNTIQYSQLFYLLLVELPNYSTEAELYSNEDFSSVENEEQAKEDSVHLNEVYDSNTSISATSSLWSFAYLTFLTLFAILKYNLL